MGQCRIPKVRRNQLRATLPCWLLGLAGKLPAAVASAVAPAVVLMYLPVSRMQGAVQRRCTRTPHVLLARLLQPGQVS